MTRATSSAEHGEFFGGLAGELHAEALAAHGVRVVPFEAGLADDDLGQAFLRLRDELLRLEAAFVARLQHDDRERARLVVDRIEALDAEFFAPRLRSAARSVPTAASTRSMGCEPLML